jgi:hypothetical protein
MGSRLIPRSEWPRFFDEFGRRHEGWLVTVRVLHPSIGSQVEARDIPLEGTVASGVAHAPISLHLGKRTDGHVEHEVKDPSQVWIETSDQGADRALGVLSDDGTETIVELRAPALVEEVNGIVNP